jgi:hypothetical protein
LDWLSPSRESKDRHAYHQKNRAPNSGSWFRDAFEKWLQEPSKCFVGSGGRKTSLLFAKANENQRDLGSPF